MENTNKTDGKTSTESCFGVEEKQIRSLSKFDRNCIEVLRCLVPDQQLHISGNGTQEWNSKCIDIDGLAITTITRGDKVIVKIVYDYDSSTEQEFWECE